MIKASVMKELNNSRNDRVFCHLQTRSRRTILNIEFHLRLPSPSHSYTAEEAVPLWLLLTAMLQQKFKKCYEHLVMFQMVLWTRPQRNASKKPMNTSLECSKNYSKDLIKTPHICDDGLIKMLQQMQWTTNYNASTNAMDASVKWF